MGSIGEPETACGKTDKSSFFADNPLTSELSPEAFPPGI